MPALRDGATVRFVPPGARVTRTGTLRQTAPGRFTVIEMGTGVRYPADGRLRYVSIDGQACNEARRVAWWVREVASA